MYYRIIPNPLTIYNNIFKVRSGEIIVFNKSVKWEKKYWSFDFSNDIDDEKEACSKLEELFLNSVKYRLECDVDVGVLLSGGLDSSLITALIRKFTNKELHSFSIAFEHENFNELYYADIVSKYFNTKHHTYIITPNDAISALNRLLLNYGEPFAFPTAIPCYFMNKIANNYVKVNLTGDGSDEIYAGYNRYKLFKKLFIENKYNGQIVEAYYEVLVDGLNDNLKNLIYNKPLKRYLNDKSIRC